jgi:hypothetical protein
MDLQNQDSDPAQGYEEGNEWSGGFDPFADPEERRVLFAALDSFRYVYNFNSYSLGPVEGGFILPFQINFSHLNGLWICRGGLELESCGNIVCILFYLLNMGISRAISGPSLDWKEVPSI